MSVDIKIVDGRGTGNVAGVDQEGAVLFTERLTPPYGAPTINVAYRQRS